MKLFYGCNIYLPVPWQRALGMAAHNQYGAVIAVAALKADAANLICDSGVPVAVAERITAALRLHRDLGHMPKDAEMLLNAGVVQIRPGIWAFHHAVHSSLVIEVRQDRELVKVARFSHDGKALTVQRTEGD